MKVDMHLIYFWYDNHHFKIENITATNVYDHGFIDFHTNNDRFTIKNAKFFRKLYDGELIYFHGDYGTNDNNVLSDINLQVTNNNGQEGMDIWSIGYNNYFDGITILDIYEHAAIEIMGIGNNLTLKNVKIKSRGYHGIVISSATDLDKMLFENISIEGVDYANYYRDFSFQSTNTANVIIRNPTGDNNNIKN